MKRGKECKWFAVCPLKRFYESGRLSEKWIKDYCRGDFRECARYKLEESGLPHPDNMMPDGTIEGQFNGR